MAPGSAGPQFVARPAKEILLYAGAIDRLGETPGPQVTVVVGMPGHPAMIPPTNEELEAAQVQNRTRQALYRKHFKNTSRS